MPTNVPPQYREAEDRFRQATTTQAKIVALQEMMVIGAPSWQRELGLSTLPGIRLSVEETVVIPFWTSFILAAILTAILWHRDRRTVKSGCCDRGGYDLRASKRVCPECWSIICPST